ncbi:hypothetical protein LWI29_023710 [Acer saccharum]|uniref:Uncharacterized protein n=1 Tax=Acer saccharum TaxID=4024 RepID=A0AA39W8W3_ACESA|nr:hypothetical protein LWI29_023710 [Acer saccharum]
MIWTTDPHYNDDLFYGSSSYLDDFQAANVRVGPTITESPSEEVRWHGPDVHFYKINTDAAVSESDACTLLVIRASLLVITRV